MSMAEPSIQKINLWLGKLIHWALAVRNLKLLINKTNESKGRTLEKKNIAQKVLLKHLGCVSILYSDHLQTVRVLRKGFSKQRLAMGVKMGCLEHSYLSIEKSI